MSAQADRTMAALMAQRRERQWRAVRAVDAAIRALRLAESSMSLWTDGVSQVVERELGIGPGDEDMNARLAAPEHSAALEFYGRTLELVDRAIRLRADLAEQRSPVSSRAEDARRAG